MFTFTQSVVTSKNVSQGTHHVRKSSRPVFPPTHLIVGARNCVRRRPGFEATLQHFKAKGGFEIVASILGIGRMHITPSTFYQDLEGFH